MRPGGREGGERGGHSPDIGRRATISGGRTRTRTRVSQERARAALGDLGDLRLVRHPHVLLRERVWELRHNLTSYDATYLALAEALPAPLLITGDGGLATVARTLLGDAAVRATGCRGDPRFQLECPLIDVMSTRNEEAPDRSGRGGV